MPPRRRAALFATVLSFGSICAVPPHALAEKPAEELTIQQRDAIEENMAPAMVLPETAIWQFAPIKPYLGSQRLACGAVNYQSAMRRYMGFHRFYAILDDDRVILAQIQNDGQDPAGRLRNKLDFLCGKA